MIRSQQIALALGVVWEVVTTLRPPVLVPASGDARPAVALTSWGSFLVRDYGVDIAYFAGELLAIAALTAGLIYFLKPAPGNSARRRR